MNPQLFFYAWSWPLCGPSPHRIERLLILSMTFKVPESIKKKMLLWPVWIICNSFLPFIVETCFHRVQKEIRISCTIRPVHAVIGTGSFPFMRPHLPTPFQRFSQVPDMGRYSTPTGSYKTFTGQHGHTRSPKHQKKIFFVVVTPLR